MIIAIDGPAAAGKGTLARRLAEKFNFAYLDTGALYRAVALTLIKGGVDPSNEPAAEKASKALDHALLSDPELRLEDTGKAASVVASMLGVRSNLMDFQKNFGVNPPSNKSGAVLDGRDIGTVICPAADVKFFVTASAEERAKRRVAEMRSRGVNANFEEILADVKARDERDMGRKDAPLEKAADAHLLDTTDLAIDAVFLRAAAIVENCLKPQ
ncbi:(d)CMP kinase [Kordiimonas sp. SCSIO 12610]|uniref:(d)CMP kinase n=1 Tax=Kordiimonas sp. SCSIO 12610 TaxID=2829597 RepID=UPI002108777D|nr:(d)CMP kinase [Kordiimonas sp. SCSIO 12610]UTW55339.1 (d)CMP kinase [Kordiimonas sp. SCSIO 12610]